MKTIDEIYTIYLNNIYKKIGASKWFLVNQKLIDKFVLTIFYNYFIYTNIQKPSKETAISSTISHNFLILSLSRKFKMEVIPYISGEKMKINHAFHKVRFTNPVKGNDRIRGHFLLQEISKRSENKILFNYKLTTEIKGKEKPALLYDWLSLSVF